MIAAGGDLVRSILPLLGGAAGSEVPGGEGDGPVRGGEECKAGLNLIFCKTIKLAYEGCGD